MAERKRWRKILYEDQGVPDNYVDSSFLEELKKNLNIRTHDFWTVVKESGVVTQQLCSLCLFVVIYVHMTENSVTPEFVLTVSSSVTFIGCAISRVIGRQSRAWWDDVKTGIVFLTFGLGMSPIMMTLTESISTDTIYAMTFFMLLANLLFHDYGTNAAIVSQSLSLNAAIFASVCLASRLPTTWHAFATVTQAAEIFALWPELRRQLKLNVPYAHVTVTAVLVVMTTVAIASVSPVGSIILSIIVVFITFICPAWLLCLQPFKNTVHGPWDEAVVR